MRRITHSAVINRPAAEVFAFLTDFTNNAQWETGVVEARHSPPGPVHVGTTVAEVRPFMGRRMATTYDVTAYEPPHRVVLKSTSRLIQVTGVYTVEPVEGGTRVTDAAEFDTQGIFKLAGPMFTGMVKRTMVKNFATMKRVLESRPAS